MGGLNRPMLRRPKNAGSAGPGLFLFIMEELFNHSIFLSTENLNKSLIIASVSWGAPF